MPLEHQIKAMLARISELEARVKALESQRPILTLKKKEKSNVKV